VVETSQGINTNEYGFYSLSLPEGSYQINYSYVGYETTTIDIELTQNITRDIELGTASTDLVEVLVTAENENDNITNTEVSVVSLDVKDIKKIPVLFGEQDILKTMQLMPGVSANSIQLGRAQRCQALQRRYSGSIRWSGFLCHGCAYAKRQYEKMASLRRFGLDFFKADLRRTDCKRPRFGHSFCKAYLCRHLGCAPLGK